MDVIVRFPLHLVNISLFVQVSVEDVSEFVDTNISLLLCVQFSIDVNVVVPIRTIHDHTICRQVIYDPAKIRDVEFDLSIVPSQTSPVYRAMANEFLMELFKANAISVEQLLQAGDFPFADELLQNIQSQKEQMERGQMPNGVSPELLQQAQRGADPKAMQMLQQAAAYPVRAAA